MSLTHALRSLKHPFVALALCAVLAQQLVGVVLAASPVLAAESGLSICLGASSDTADPQSDAAGDPAFCPCTLTGLAVLEPPQPSITVPGLVSSASSLPANRALLWQAEATGPPPARGPPLTLHS